MPDANADLLLRLIGGDARAATEVLDTAATSTCPSLLTAAAVLTGDPALLIRAGHHAITTRDRQLLALAGAHLRGESDLVEALVQDHLQEHPDSLLASWISQDPDHH